MPAAAGRIDAGVGRNEQESAASRAAGVALVDTACLPEQGVDGAGGFGAVNDIGDDCGGGRQLARALAIKQYLTGGIAIY